MSPMTLRRYAVGFRQGRKPRGGLMTYLVYATFLVVVRAAGAACETSRLAPKTDKRLFPEPPSTGPNGRDRTFGNASRITGNP